MRERRTEDAEENQEDGRRRQTHEKGGETHIVAVVETRAASMDISSNRLDISSNLSRALSCLRLSARYLVSGHNFLVQKMRHNRNRRPYKIRICDKRDCTLFRMRKTFCWTVPMNILLASTHSTASWSSHLNLKIAQLV